jgi:hypothetical protein
MCLARSNWYFSPPYTPVSGKTCRHGRYIWPFVAPFHTTPSYATGSSLEVALERKNLCLASIYEPVLIDNATTHVVFTCPVREQVATNTRSINKRFSLILDRPDCGSRLYVSRMAWNDQKYPGSTWKFCSGSLRLFLNSSLKI